MYGFIRMRPGPDRCRRGNSDPELTTSIRTGMILCLGRDITDQMEREKLLKEAKAESDRLAIMKDSFGEFSAKIPRLF
jgi:orotidine-5'-phosphate decarboxylase